jgi:translation initiation factor IF-3
MRITKQDLEAKEKRINELLEKDTNIKIKVSYRYNYVAIDIFLGNKIFDTLIAGLTKKEAYNILESIEKALAFKKT